MMTRRAFSLIEVLIACSILAIGMCAAIVLFPAALRNYRISRALTDSAVFAKNKLQEVKALRVYADGSGRDGFINWTVAFDNVTVANATMRRMTLHTAYVSAGARVTDEFVTYVDQ